MNMNVRQSYHFVGWDSLVLTAICLFNLFYQKLEKLHNSSRNQGWVDSKEKDAERLVGRAGIKYYEVLIFLSRDNPKQLAWVAEYGTFKVHRFRAWKKLKEILPKNRDEENRSLLMVLYCNAEDRKVSRWALSELQNYPEMKVSSDELTELV